MLLVLSPLPQEMKAIQRGLEKRGFKCTQQQIGQLRSLHFKDLNLHLGVGGHGKTQFALQSQHLIQASGKFKTLVCAGCGGSLDKKVKVFDVVVGTKTIEHDFNLKFAQRPLPEFSGDAALLEKIKPKNFDFPIHFGSIASGDEDVIEAERALVLQKNTNAIAVAWEGAGAARAAKFNKLSFLEVRGVTDLADSSSLEQVMTNVEKAMDHVAATLVVLPSVTD